MDQDLLRNFLEWYAVFYALALGVIVSETWAKRSRINAEIDREADSLKLLLHTARLFPNKTLSKNLVVAVYNYAVCVLRLKGSDHRSKTDSHTKMQAIQECVYALIQDRDESSETLKSELLRQYCEAYDARGDRFDLIAQRMPAQMWIILGVFSLTWLWGFLWIEFHESVAERYIIGSTAWAIGYLFFLARDLNDPNRGSWKLNFRPFVDNLF